MADSVEGRGVWSRRWEEFRGPERVEARQVILGVNCVRENCREHVA